MPVQLTIRSIAVRGNQRLESETIRAYANLAPGQTYATETLDQALKSLYATQLFADVQITGAETGDLVISVRENPVINRIVLEGNKRLKDDKILPEIKLAPRQIFTRSAARADVDRILELYRRQGRFAARVEPKIVQLDQNRVDVVFEIHEGNLAKVRAINIIGNKEFSDERLRREMYTRQAGGMLSFLKSNNTYDPDRLAADQQKLRAFYLTQGYADFRVVQALAELTPDRRDFVITYVVEEGPRYKFGKIDATSVLRDFPASTVKQYLASSKLKSADWFNAKTVEDAVTDLNEKAGNLGYAFADINPSYDRDAEHRLMNLTVRIGETPRVYVERIDITGNTTTRDKVIRREFRLNEGDAFSALKVKRSQERIQSLGFFQEKLEIKQSEGSSPDRVVLGVNVEERPTGQLSLSGGLSSTEGWVTQLGISQNNFMGKGQGLSASINVSKYTKSAELGFSDPYLFDKQVSLGGQIFRSDYSNYYSSSSDGSSDTVQNYRQISTGFKVTTGIPLSDYVTSAFRYSLADTKFTLNSSYYTNGECDVNKAGATLCDEVGTRLTSAIGSSLLYDNTDGIRPTRGQRLSLGVDFAGLGGNVRYVRTRGDATKYLSLGSGFVLSAHAEGGYIRPLQSSSNEGRDPIHITDRFFVSQMHGFDLRGIGPRVLRTSYDDSGDLDPSQTTRGDGLGGRSYYLGGLELQIPVSASLRTYGLSPLAYLQVGSLWGLTTPKLTDVIAYCTNSNDSSDYYSIGKNGTCANGYSRSNGYKETFVGNSPRPRVSIGIGLNWVSPMGPLRLDISKALLKQEGDETKLFNFNVGTQF